MRDCLAIRSFVADVSQTRNFYSTCNFDIIMLNTRKRAKPKISQADKKALFLTRNGL
ncbi:hypothetical protein [Campylobacter concisus]